MRISDWSSDVCSSDLIEVRNVVDRRQPERIEPCRLMTAHAVVVDQTQHTGLLLRRLGIEAGFGGDHAMWLACEPLEARNHFAVRNLTRGILILDQAEICPPARIDRLGIVEELFVVRLDRSEEHTSELQSLMRIQYAV